MLRISFITIFSATFFAFLVNQCVNAAICRNPGSYSGNVVCDPGNPKNCGQCPAFVRKCTGLGSTSTWVKGIKVRGANIAAGTAIATFNLKVGQNIKFDTNATQPGKGHAAIYTSQNSAGIQVWDQWVISPGVYHPVSQRTIRFKGGVPNTHGNSDDGDQFYVIN